jgi:hypothetical protein
MAKKNRATFAKREKERARLSKQAEKRARRQQTPDPNAPSVPGPMPSIAMFGDDSDAPENEDSVAASDVSEASDAPSEPEHTP